MNQQQLQIARAALWHQNGSPLATYDDAAPWLDETGFCLFLPRHAQLPAPAPSFVEACMGEASMMPAPVAIASAMELAVRLVDARRAVPLNLMGAFSEQPDFLATPEVLPWVAAIRGDRNWKTAPGGRTSPIVLRTWEALEKRGGQTAVELREVLGREVTEAAVLRALIELWGTLRAVPTYTAGEPTRWNLLKDWHSAELAAGANASQATALSAMISIYLRSAVAATAEEAEVFLSPLTARSRIREVLHGMTASRSLGTTTVGTDRLLFIEGSLPEMPEVEAAEGAAEAAGGERPEARRERTRPPRGEGRREEKPRFERGRAPRPERPAARGAAGEARERRGEFRRSGTGASGGRGFRRAEGSEGRPAFRGKEGRPVRGGEKKPWEKKAGERKPWQKRGEGAGFGRRAEGGAEKPPREGEERREFRGKREERPAFRPEKRPAFRREERPAFKKEGRPAFPQKGPGFKREGAPTFKRADRPGFKREGAPTFKRAERPGFKREGAPTFKRPDRPGFKREGAPTFKRADRPGFKREGAPTFKRADRPGFKREGAPTFRRAERPGLRQDGEPRPQVRAGGEARPWQRERREGEERPQREGRPGFAKKPYPRKEREGAGEARPKREGGPRPERGGKKFGGRPGFGGPRQAGGPGRPAGAARVSRPGKPLWKARPDRGEGQERPARETGKSARPGGFSRSFSRKGKPGGKGFRPGKPQPGGRGPQSRPRPSAGKRRNQEENPE